ncbi:winged helix-turn-helix domain-containing protein [Plantactinospora solaniradicis]|uniref:Winged helix-turn-helix domain-containing protein n=1 Tax=Plantactinospora solaniradicis TaxID=1723736 RepID=A0ABW1K7P5_9ACTN
MTSSDLPAGATVGASRVADGPQLVVSVRLFAGPGSVSPGVARLVESLSQLAQAPQVARRRVVPQSWVLRILLDSRIVLRGEEEIPLTRREFDLLRHLAQHPRRVFTRAQLLDQVWGHAHLGHRTVDVHVRRLRAKVGLDVPLVATLRGVGYRLGDEVTVAVVPEVAPVQPNR